MQKNLQQISYAISTS